MKGSRGVDCSHMANVEKVEGRGAKGANMWI